MVLNYILLYTDEDLHLCTIKSPSLREWDNLSVTVALKYLLGPHQAKQMRPIIKSSRV